MKYKSATQIAKILREDYYENNVYAREINKILIELGYLDHYFRITEKAKNHYKDAYYLQPFIQFDEEVTNKVIDFYFDKKIF